MPQYPPASGVFRAVMQMTVFGQECRNVFHFSSAIGILPIGAGGLADALETWWKTSVRPIQNSSVLLHSIAVQDLGSEGAPAHLKVISTPNTGGMTGTHLPNNVAACVTFRTNLAGKSYRGRAFHVGVNSSHISGNTLTPAYITALTAAYGELVNVSGGFWSNAKQLGVLSYWHNKTLRETPVFTPVQVVSVEGNVDSMRRRLTGRGR